MIIRTERLNLVPMSLEFMRASLEGRLTEAELLLGASLPDGWPDSRHVLEMRIRQLEANPALAPWLLRAVVLRATHAMIGRIGFHDAPGAEYLEPYSPGAAEFGYTIAPEHRRQGYAREGVTALMNWARTEHGVGSFVLCIGPNNVPSQSLAAGLGFRKIGSHLDDIDGEEDILELKMEVYSDSG